MCTFKGSLPNIGQIQGELYVKSSFRHSSELQQLSSLMESSFTIVVVGLLQDDLGGGVNGVDLFFFDGGDSLDSKNKLVS